MKCDEPHKYHYDHNYYYHYHHEFERSSHQVSYNFTSDWNSLFIHTLVNLKY
jgi:hypothetical protein